MTAWIRMIPDEEADADLAAALDEARTPHGTVDDVMRVHSLRPATMRGHVALHRAALHHEANTLPPWLGEVIAPWVSILNGCAYSHANHWANARRLIGDEARADAMGAALDTGRPQDALSGPDLAAVLYAGKLTRDPAAMERADVDAPRAAGWDDAQVLEVNQIAAYFAYADRLLNGLGVTTEGDVVGYYAESD